MRFPPSAPRGGGKKRSSERERERFAAFLRGGGCGGDGGGRGGKKEAWMETKTLSKAARPPRAHSFPSYVPPSSSEFCKAALKGRVKG